MMKHLTVYALPLLVAVVSGVTAKPIIIQEEKDFEGFGQYGNFVIGTVKSERRLNCDQLWNEFTANKQWLDSLNRYHKEYPQAYCTTNKRDRMYAHNCD